MTFNGWLQIALYCAIIVALVKPMGGYMTRLFAGERTFLGPVLAPIERGLYCLAGIDPDEDQHWTHYALAMLLFNLAGFLLLYLPQRLQGVLPLNPEDFAAVDPDLAFNTAVSFTTNTNWQAYVGEATMSYLVQMMGLTVQNFVSAATGIALAVALIRGFARRSARGIGNVWADLVRGTLYILLPLCFLGALVLVWQGVPQNLNDYVTATTVEGGEQVIGQGPVASQMMIKHLGTNGGGFFNANAAHPYENPTALTNLITIVAIFLIGAALTNTFGRMVKDERQGWVIFAAMGIVFIAGVAIAYWAEAGGNPLMAPLGVDIAGGNMEGKEVRFGPALSALFATITTAASCGAVNAMHDSFMPLGGFVPLFNILLGEIIIGGVGAGLYGMLLLAVLILPLSLLGFLAIASITPAALASPLNAGPHGFSEIFYAYASATGNNGSAFAGLTADTWFYNLTLGAAMLLGRFAMIVPMLAVAGALAAKGKVPASSGTFPTDGALFIGLLVSVVLVVGALTYLPALALGPIVEHFAMLAGEVF